MQRHLAFVISLCLCVATAASAQVSDMTQICAGRSDGDRAPHPVDCQAYFSCALVPTLLYCEQGLHFDAVHSVCDVPERANCLRAQILSTNSTTSDSSTIDWESHKPRPVFVAVDVASGQPVDPMDKYDPQHIECRHFGAYFLPHPRSCQQYFICAYGHLHRHQCGSGTNWNYKSAECQLIDAAECFSNTHSDANEQPTEVSVSPTASGLPLSTTSSISLVTVCYIVGDGSTMLSTPTTTVDSTSPLSSDASKISTTTVANVVSTPRVESSALACPSNRQSYLPHPDDCSKYYICIIGMPVLTSCPKGLYWDQKSGYCDLAKYVNCFQSE